MFRLWGKMMKENRMLRDIVISNGDYTMSRTAMVFDAIDQICYAFDLGHPVWLDKTIEEFKRHDKARFTQDNFSRASISIIWRYRCWKNKGQAAVTKRQRPGGARWHRR